MTFTPLFKPAIRIVNAAGAVLKPPLVIPPVQARQPGDSGVGFESAIVTYGLKRLGPWEFPADNWAQGEAPLGFRPEIEIKLWMNFNNGADPNYGYSMMRIFYMAATIGSTDIPGSYPAAPGFAPLQITMFSDAGTPVWRGVYMASDWNVLPAGKMTDPTWPWLLKAYGKDLILPGDWTAKQW